MTESRLTCEDCSGPFSGISINHFGKLPYIGQYIYQKFSVFLDPHRIWVGRCPPHVSSLPGPSFQLEQAPSPILHGHIPASRGVEPSFSGRVTIHCFPGPRHHSCHHEVSVHGPSPLPCAPLQSLAHVQFYPRLSGLLPPGSGIQLITPVLCPCPLPLPWA